MLGNQSTIPWNFDVFSTTVFIHLELYSRNNLEISLTFLI